MKRWKWVDRNMANPKRKYNLTDDQIIDLQNNYFRWDPGYRKKMRRLDRFYMICNDLIADHYYKKYLNKVKNNHGSQ